MPDQPDAIPNPLATAVQRELGRNPTPATRRAVAARLRALAERQERFADADRDHGATHRRREMDAAPRTGGRPKGSGGRFVRLEAPSGQQATYRLHIGRALWQECGQFERVHLSGRGGAVTLTPAARGDADAYVVTRPRDGMPRISLGEATVESLGLTEGRHPAMIAGGAIRVG